MELRRQPAHSTNALKPANKGLPIYLDVSWCFEMLCLIAASAKIFVQNTTVHSKLMDCDTF